MKHEWPITTDSPVVQALKEGRRKIEKGWIKGAIMTKNGYCATGAIMENGWELMGEAMRFLYANLPPRARGSIAVYNDDPRTTKADILTLYDRAIKLAAEKRKV